MPEVFGGKQFAVCMEKHRYLRTCLLIWKNGRLLVCEGDRMQVGTLELFEAELEREIDRLTVKKMKIAGLLKRLVR